MKDQDSTTGTRSGCSTHPVTNIIRCANVYERAHAALEERSEVELRGPRVPVVRRPEGVGHLLRRVLERPALGGVDAEEVLSLIAAQVVLHVAVYGCREHRGRKGIKVKGDSTA